MVSCGVDGPELQRGLAHAMHPRRQPSIPTPTAQWRRPGLHGIPSPPAIINSAKTAMAQARPRLILLSAGKLQAAVGGRSRARGGVVAGSEENSQRAPCVGIYAPR